MIARLIQSHRRRRFGSGRGPASDIFQSGAVEGFSRNTGGAGDDSDSVAEGGAVGEGPRGAIDSGAAVKRAPHSPQNRLPAGLVVPQFEQAVNRFPRFLRRSGRRAAAIPSMMPARVASAGDSTTA